MDNVTDTLARWIRFLPVRPLHYGLALALWLGQSFAIFSPQGIPLSTSYDSMVKNRIVAASPDPDIVIVDIDEASLARMADEYGRWPWPRDTLAATVEYLERQELRVSFLTSYSLIPTSSTLLQTHLLHKALKTVKKPGSLF